ncbi:hypothetical protein DFP73DRAFT_346048 [Morchella snyderi]|nr:hypothetical protein DFP73DRAFT_346048 [Morchella snyderi]
MQRQHTTTALSCRDSINARTQQRGGWDRPAERQRIRNELPIVSDGGGGCGLRRSSFCFSLRPSSSPTSPWPPHLGSPQATTSHRHHRRRTGGPCGGRDVVSGLRGRDEIYTHLRNNLRLMTCVRTYSIHDAMMGCRRCNCKSATLATGIYHDAALLRCFPPMSSVPFTPALTTRHQITEGKPEKLPTFISPFDAPMFPGICHAHAMLCYADDLVQHQYHHHHARCLSKGSLIRSRKGGEKHKQGWI